MNICDTSVIDRRKINICVLYILELLEVRGTKHQMVELLVNNLL
jgi:hypothetical protein